MKKNIHSSILVIYSICGLAFSSLAQFPMPPQVPIWDANKVELKLHKIADGIYAILPSTAEKETTKGIPQATTGGFVIGETGVLIIETMLTKRLFDQQMKLLRSITNKPVLYAVNTSDHGDHCFTNYLLPSSTMIIQNESAEENLSKNFEGIKQFMVMLFGKERGIEDSKFRRADITVSKNNSLKIDLGNDKIIECINLGTAQSPADLFVWIPSSKVFWAGNPFIGERPTIPWLFDGFFLEPYSNLKKIYDFLPGDAIVIPGHGKITNKEGIKYTIDYVSELKRKVEEAVINNFSLEEAKASIKMEDYNRGYSLFNWLHYNFNLPNAYKDIKKNMNDEALKK